MTSFSYDYDDPLQMVLGEAAKPQELGDQVPSSYRLVLEIVRCD